MKRFPASYMPDTAQASIEALPKAYSDWSNTGGTYEPAVFERCVFWDRIIFMYWTKTSQFLALSYP